MEEGGVGYHCIVSAFIGSGGALGNPEAGRVVLLRDVALDGGARSARLRPTRPLPVSVSCRRGKSLIAQVHPCRDGPLSTLIRSRKTPGSEHGSGPPDQSQEMYQSQSLHGAVVNDDSRHPVSSIKACMHAPAWIPSRTHLPHPCQHLRGHLELQQVKCNVCCHWDGQRHSM